MLKILPKITFGQIQTTTNPQKPTCEPTLERTPKHDCVSFGNINEVKLFQMYTERAKKLTLADNLISQALPEDDSYQLPANFFFAMKNAPSRHLIEKIPAVVQDCGLPIDIALQKLDKMANILRATRNYIQIPKFKLGNKTLWSSEVGQGSRGTVHHFISGKENLAFKVFHVPTMIANHGLFGETALAREFTKAGTIDTAELYMASPHQHTGWMLSEYVDNSTKKPTSGPTHESFLSKYRLEMGDAIDPNYIKDSRGNPIRIDFGGVTGKVPIYIRPAQKMELFTETNPQEAFNDEGTIISALKKYILNSNSVDSNDAKDALNTPEGRFASEMHSPNAKKENIESALRDIDVVGGFIID